MKKCQYCAEEIQDAAIVCKHCGRDLPKAQVSMTGTPLPDLNRPAAPTPVKPAAKIPVNLIGFMILGTLAVIMFLSNREDQKVEEASAASLTAPAATTSHNPTPTPGDQVMPANETYFLAAFKQACEAYDAALNQIQKSDVFTRSRALLTKQPVVRDWHGTLKSIRTNQGGSEADIVISFGTSELYARDVPRGSGIYSAATGMSEGQPVTFSSGPLRDDNITERGKVCEPYFAATLAELK